jgi:hypothetical protein
MNFVHPLFLLGLFFLIIPIVVHFFNFRKYQKIFFTNTKLLKSIVSETKKVSELKKRLLFLSRLLAFFFIVMAFAQPYFREKSIGQENPIISIYIDNSESMGLFDRDQRLLDIAKQKATEIVNDFKEKAQYQIITNNFGSSELQMVRYSEAISLIQGVKLSPNSKMLDEVFSKQVQSTQLFSNNRTTFYAISDFQKYQCQAVSQKDARFVFIPLKNNANKNQYIDSAWIDAPFVKINQDVGVIIRIKKQKEEESKEVICRLEVNGKLKQSRRLQWTSNSLTDTLYYKISESNWNRVKVSISDENMLFDNDYYLSFLVQEKPIVTIVSDFASTQYLESALKTEDHFIVHKYQSIAIPEEEFKLSNLLILNQIQSFNANYLSLIQKMQSSGKPTILFMPSNASIESYNKVFEKLGVDQIVACSNQKMFVKDVNIQEDLMRDVLNTNAIEQSMPYSERYYELNGKSKLAKEPIITFRNGMPLMMKYSKPNEGPLYVFTSSLDIQYSDFVQKALFAPMMFKLGNSATQLMKSSYIMDPNTTISYPVKQSNKDDFFELKGPQVSIIPPQKQVGFMIYCNLNEVIAQSGFYQLVNKAKTNSFEVALNYNRKESTLEFLSVEELENLYRDQIMSILKPDTSLAQTNKELANGFSIWKTALWCALFFIMMEVVLLIFGDQILSKLDRK